RERTSARDAATIVDIATRFDAWTEDRSEAIGLCAIMVGAVIVATVGVNVRSLASTLAPPTQVPRTMRTRLPGPQQCDYNGHMTKAAVAQLKAQISHYLRRVKAGEEVIVTERGVPVARIVPIGSAAADDEHLRDLERQGLIRVGTGKLPKDF